MIVLGFNKYVFNLCNLYIFCFYLYPLYKHKLSQLSSYSFVLNGLKSQLMALIMLIMNLNISFIQHKIINY